MSVAPSVTAPLTASVAALEQRAHALRCLAQRIDALPLSIIGVRSGPDTWCGPTAEGFALDLTRCRLHLVTAAATARAVARALDADAARARLAQVATGPS
jgi:hypothetical protein